MIQHNPKKLVHASDFMYRANRFDWLGGTQQEQLYHSVWQGLRAGNARMFLMPKSICCHRFLDNKQSATTAWEVYDMNLAGCLLCGDMHVCQDGFCPVEKNSEGHDICTVTGMCIKMLSFSNEEFVDTACVPLSSASGDRAAAGREGGYYDLSNQGVVFCDDGDRDDVFSTSGASFHLSKKNQQPLGPKKNIKKTTRTIASNQFSSPWVKHNNQQQQMNNNNVCSVNKKNRYRSWVYHRVMHNHLLHHSQVFRHLPPLLQENSAHVSSWRLKQSGEGGATTSNAHAPVSKHHHHHHMDRQKKNDLSSSNCGSSGSSSRMGELIQLCVEDVLCGPKWKLSMDTEDQKMRAKKRSLTLKAFKLLKGKANAKICLPEAAALVASMMGNSGRHPHKDAPIEERRAICDWCVDTIHRHICLINSMCQGVVTDAKLKTTTIGLLYMMRQGIVVHDMVVLPKLPQLESLLPLENHLDLFFGVKAKCITETENVVKIILRSVTKQQLIDAGVSSVACKL